MIIQEIIRGTDQNIHFHIRIRLHDPADLPYAENAVDPGHALFQGPDHIGGGISVFTEDHGLIPLGKVEIKVDPQVGNEFAPDIIPDIDGFSIQEGHQGILEVIALPYAGFPQLPVQHGKDIRVSAVCQLLVAQVIAAQAHIADDILIHIAVKEQGAGFLKAVPVDGRQIVDIAELNLLDFLRGKGSRFRFDIRVQHELDLLNDQITGQRQYVQAQGNQIVELLSAPGQKDNAQIADDEKQREHDKISDLQTAGPESAVKALLRDLNIAVFISFVIFVGRIPGQMQQL